jgi:hypothetical protein
MSGVGYGKVDRKDVDFSRCLALNFGSDGFERPSSAGYERYIIAIFSGKES